MWTIKEIYEADYGCEERMPGQPLMVGVNLVCDDGRVVQFEVQDEWLTEQNLDEGDLWPEDIDAIMDDAANEKVAKTAQKQMDFMDNYLNALEALEEDE